MFSYSGFQLEYTTMAPTNTTNPTTAISTTTIASTSTTCGELLQESQGHFASPNIHGTYSNNLNCEWVIRANNTSDRIKIEFIHFSLEDQLFCNYDYLEIRDGGKNDSILVGNYCGTTVPGVFISSNNQLFIKLSTDYSVTASGFNISYQTGPLSQLTSCGGTIQEIQGQLASPNHPAHYPNDLNCKWVIRSNDTRDRIKIMFQNFSVENHPNCGYDYVEVYNGAESVSNIVGKYCGQNLPRAFISSGNHLAIKLYTDAYVTGPGFLISYQIGPISNLTTCDANATTFNCSDGSLHCMPAFMVCDGFQECLDGSDEDPGICYDYQICDDNEFTCSSGNPKCIPMYFKCDGHQHCSDGSDEAHEVCGHLRCPLDSMINGGQGNLISPNHPGIYPNNLDCLWHIR